MGHGGRARRALSDSLVICVSITQYQSRKTCAPEPFSLTFTARRLRLCATMREPYHRHTYVVRGCLRVDTQGGSWWPFVVRAGMRGARLDGYALKSCFSASEGVDAADGPGDPAADSPGVATADGPGDGLPRSRSEKRSGVGELAARASVTT